MTQAGNKTGYFSSAIHSTKTNHHHHHHHHPHHHHHHHHHHHFGYFLKQCFAVFIIMLSNFVPDIFIFLFFSLFPLTVAIATSSKLKDFCIKLWQWLNMYLEIRSLFQKVIEKRNSAFNSGLSINIYTSKGINFIRLQDLH